MTNITGGTLSYSRTVKVADFEPKKVEIMLSFGVDEGEDVEKILDHVGQTALRHAHKLLGVKVPAETAAAATSETAGKVKAATAKMDQKAGRGAAAVPAAAEAAVKTVMDATAVVDEKPAISTGEARVDPAQVADEVDELDEVVEDITDAALADAAKAVNQRTKNAVEIKKLRDQYAGKSPAILSDIPKAKRRAFLTDLDKIT